MLDFSYLHNFLRPEILVMIFLLILLVILGNKFQRVRNFFHQTDIQKSQEKNRIAFTLIIFAMAVVLIFLYGYSSIFFRNFEGDLKLAILLFGVISYFLFSLLFLFVSSQGIYQKEIGVLGFMLIIVFFIYQDSNSLLGRICVALFGLSFGVRENSTRQRGLGCLDMESRIGSKILTKERFALEKL